MKFPLLAQHCKRLTPLLAAPAALLLSQGQAKAVLTYNIFESAGNVVVQTSGSLNFTGATAIGTIPCGANGGIISRFAVVCTGLISTISNYAIDGPSNFDGTVSSFPANSVTGISTILDGSRNFFAIGPAYISNTPIVSSATFNSTTLLGLGFTTTGLIGTWQLQGVQGSDGQINLCIGSGPCGGAAVPGPLPLLGAGAAFGWSRKLRKRIATPLITPPQA